MTYHVKMTRQTAVRYVTWEFGLANTQRILSQLEPASPGFYRLPIAESLATPSRLKHPRKADMLALVRKIQVANAYQAGRLGKPLNPGDCYVYSA